jgi:molybdopterin synthase catalytic subunit/molybdopterin converting factor small subunit
MRVEVRLFGGLAEHAGTARTVVDVTGRRVADLRRAVAEAHPALAPMVDRVAVAVDLEVADDATVLHGDEELALLPPVAGGAEPLPSVRVVRGDVRVLTGLAEGPLPVEAAVTAIAGPQVGGTVSFLGTVRDHAPDLDEPVIGLDYEAYPAMASATLATIADELVLAHPDVRGFALLHRVGHLDVGDHTVLVAAAAAHRGAAFDACRDALEQVKARVPVWKRERTAVGAHRWVGLAEDAAAEGRP